MLICADCESPVDECEQTDDEYENGICPYCGGSNLKSVCEDEEQAKYDEKVRYSDRA